MLSPKQYSVVVAAPMSVVLSPPDDPPADPGVTLSPTSKNSRIVLSNGDMTATLTDAGGDDVVGLATLAIAAGEKVRIEVQVGTTSDRVALGIGQADASTGDAQFLGCVGGNDIGNYSSSAGVWQGGSNVAGSDGFPAGSIVSIDVDTASKSISWFVDGVLSVTATYDLTGDVFFAYGLRYDTATPAQVTLIAPADFTYAPPAGYTKYGA